MFKFVIVINWNTLGVLHLGYNKNGIFDDLIIAAVFSGIVTGGGSWKEMAPFLYFGLLSENCWKIAYLKNFRPERQSLKVENQSQGNLDTELKFWALIISSIRNLQCMSENFHFLTPPIFFNSQRHCQHWQICLSVWFSCSLFSCNVSLELHLAA